MLIRKASYSRSYFIREGDTEEDRILNKAPGTTAFGQRHTETETLFDSRKIDIFFIIYRLSYIKVHT